MVQVDNKKNSAPKQMHYIPNFYLKNFANERFYIWVYDREANKYWNQATEKIAKINNYYVIKDNSDKKNYSVDNYITDVETKTNLIYRKIKKGKLINKDEKVTLSIFFALLKVRTPEWELSTNELTDKAMKELNKRRFYSLEATKKIFEEFEIRKDKKLDIDPENFYSTINDTDSYNIHYDRQNNIPLMIRMVSPISFVLFKKDWFIVNSIESCEFITSDNPFLLIPTKEQLENKLYGYGIDTVGVKKYIPLTSKKAIIIIDDGTRFTSKNIGDDFVNIHNEMVARDSKRFIFAKDKKTLEKIVEKTQIDKWQKSDRVIIQKN